MSLRFRLIGLVAIVLVVSLGLGGAIVSFIASRSVQTEMSAALLVGRQAIDNAMEDLQNSRDAQRDLRNLIASFNGNRHLNVALAGDAAAIASPAKEDSPFGDAPAWFARLIGVAPTDERIVIAIAGHRGGTIAIETDPHNEILEVWNEFCESLIVLALFCGQTILLIYLFTGRALRPLDRMAAALEKVGEGDYDTRIIDSMAPELSRLRDSFNRMAQQLAAMDQGNRDLNEQLQTLQAQERRDLARDLHDEVGPFLFTINVDAANISRLLKQGRSSEISGHVQSIAEAVGHMQREVRSMLGRLRSPGLAEFGLADAIGNMIEFWRRRNPEINYRVSIAPDCEGLGEFADMTIYRIVQECVSNAVRHGKPRAISICVRHSGDGPDGGGEIIAEVADDGHGMREPTGSGLGLLGMNERVTESGGRLTLSSNPGGGVAVVAALPYPMRHRPHTAALQASAQ